MKHGYFEVNNVHRLGPLSVDRPIPVTNADNPSLRCLFVFVLKFHVPNGAERGEYLKFWCKMQNLHRGMDGCGYRHSG
ncbi:hypothetical protein D3C72_2261350 [compost metagenome]